MTIKNKKDFYMPSEKDFIDFVEYRLKEVNTTIACIEELKLNITIFNIFRLDLILPYLYFKYYKLSKLEKSRDELSFLVNNLKEVE